MSQWPTPTAADIAAAARRVAGIAWHTPLLHSAWLSDLTGGDVWLKLELAQQTGSFKIRGAANALAVLRERRPDVREVVTASAGNHGLAVTWAARRFDMGVRVYMPRHAPEAKRRALTRLGAEVVDMPTYEDAETAAHEHASNTGVPYVPPYDDRDVVAGAATIALEMFADQPELDDVIAPIGGGGLLSGIALVARSRARATRVIGAEAAASPAFTGALAAGRIVTVRVEPTLADGLAGNMEPDSQTFDLVRDLVDQVILVQEPSIVRAMRELIAHERLIVEGASATGIGLLLERDLDAVDLRGRRVGVVVTGRNVDAATVSAVLRA